MVRLTGGKDSRLILAAALRAGIAHEFRYETIGWSGLTDADIASELASRLGLRHDLRFIGMRSDEPYDDRVRRFVEATACVNNAWTIDSPTGAPYLSVTGIGGETLRAFFKLPEGTDPERVAAQALGPRRVNRLELVRLEVAAKLATELSHRLATEPTPSSSAFTRQNAHYLGHRLRFPRVGPREEIGGDRWIQPLYLHVTIDAAMALPPRDRQSEVSSPKRCARHRPYWSSTASPVQPGTQGRRPTSASPALRRRRRSDQALLQPWQSRSLSH